MFCLVFLKKYGQSVKVHHEMKWIWEDKKKHKEIYKILKNVVPSCSFSKLVQTHPILVKIYALILTTKCTLLKQKHCIIRVEYQNLFY